MTYELGTTLKWKDEGKFRWQRGYIIRIVPPQGRSNPEAETGYWIFDTRGGHRFKHHSEVQPVRGKRGAR